jgi:hypothetical protein
MKIDKLLSTRSGHKKINSPPMRRKIWNAGDYCVYYSGGNCNFYFSHLPYMVEGALSYEDLNADDWEVFDIEL